MTAWRGFGQKNEFAAVDSGVKRDKDFCGWLIALLLWSDTVCLLFEVSAVFEIFVTVYCLLLLFGFLILILIFMFLFLQ